METLDKWHEIVRDGNMGRLSEIIHEDCVFLSPVVHTPQEGRDLTILYLMGASQVLNDSFTYVKEVVAGRHAVLEFTCELDGIAVNGVDIMTFDKEGQIIEFKVMVRPLKAINSLHAKMREMLEQLAQQDAAQQ